MPHHKDIAVSKMDIASVFPELTGQTTKMLYCPANTVIKGMARGLWEIRRGPNPGWEGSGRIPGRSDV